MVSSRDPFKGYWWPPTRGSKGHGFNHLIQGFIHVRWLAGFLNHQPALKFPSDPGLWIGVICLASKNMPQQTVTFLQKILHPWPLRIQRWKDQPKLGKKGKTHAQLGLLATKFVKKSHFVYIHPESLAFIAHDILTIPKGKHRLPWCFSGSVYKHLGWQHFTVFDCFFSPCHFFGWRGRGDKIDDSMNHNYLLKRVWKHLLPTPTSSPTVDNELQLSSVKQKQPTPPFDWHASYSPVPPWVLPKKNTDDQTQRPTTK